MVYNINNRMLYRGFHSDSTGKNKITKPDGKVVNGKWLYGCMAIVPMPVPDGAKPQMPILCLHSPDRWGKSVGDSSICPCTASLFSGTWMDTNWDDARKADQKDWLARGKTSATGRVSLYSRETSSGTSCTRSTMSLSTICWRVSTWSRPMAATSTCCLGSSV